MEVKNFIKYYNNLLTPVQVSAIIRTFNDYKFFPASVIGNGNSDEVRKEIRNTQNYGLDILKTYTETHWYHFINFRIIEAIKKYKEDVKGDFNITALYPLSLLKYETGGFYKKHVDSCKKIHRELSIIIFLNNDYEGGNLQFFNTEGEVYHEIKPSPGAVVIWPSNFMYPHAAQTVKEGTRFCFVSWAV
jgi:predicted 2-oxoglutarate/Fe(II)-dependent dioxygenase YbiX